MTATRIRETADGVLYRLSEPVWYPTWDCIRRTHSEGEAAHVVASEVGRADGIRVYAVTDTGEMLYMPIKISLTITDPDAMIEAMGYTVIREEV